MTRITSRLWRASALVSILVGAATAVGAAPAANATVLTDHCVVTIAPLRSGAAHSAILRHRCFTTFAAAISAATDGELRLSPNVKPAQVSQTMLGAINPSLTGSSIIGIDYVDINYGGGSLTWQVSNNVGCSTGLTYSSNVTGAWNNVISSSKGFTGCDINPHYDLASPNQNSGAKIFCTPDCATMGAMNDATSYEEWRP